jgi:spermidine synthase
MLAVIVFEPDTHIRNILLGSVKVIESSDSKYGNIAIGYYQGERSIFYDHRLIDYEQDEKQREENIHYAMLQHEEPRDVLIISGGSGKHIREVLKYKGVKTVSYLERDPELLALTRDSTMEYPGVDVRIVNDDAFSYIRKTDRKYDVIISLLTEPDNIVTNRFYTKEYFLDIKEILRPGGIFMLKAGVASSYISEEESAFISTVYNSLDCAFKNIMPIKGESIYLLSSDSTLTTAITDLVSERGLENTYVNSYYLNDEIISYSSQQVSELIDESLPENLLDRPRAVFYKQRYQLNKAGSNRLPAIIIISLLLLLPFIRGSNSARTMYSASLNLAGTEILALILIQSTAGNFYQLAGLLIAAVMGGLAAGSSAGIYLKDRVVELSPVLLGLLAVLFALLSPRILEFQSGSIAVIISFVLVIVPAVLAGYYYRRKTEKDINSRTISGIYFADLCGAALGFMIIAGILVPFYGIKSTFFILAFLNFASYITNQVINGIRKLIYE